MLKIIEGLPKNVLGVQAQGKVTDADYRKVLIPQANEMLTRYPAIRLLYVAGKDFKGYDAHALWDDAVFGLKHWSNFSCVVVVTDVPWLRTAAHLFSPFFPGIVKVFDLADLSAAKTWVTKSNAITIKKKPGMIKREIVRPLLYDIQHAANTGEKRMGKNKLKRQKK